MRAIADRLEAKIERVPFSTCWYWTGPNALGYGILRETRSRVTTYAHRISWILRNGGEIPKGMQVDHLCSEPSCVNPDHLEVVTPLANRHRTIARGRNATPKTHCPWGHEYTEENTRLYRGRRFCRVCRKEWPKRKRTSTLPT